MENEIELFFWLGTCIMFILSLMVIIVVLLYQKNMHKYKQNQAEHDLQLVLAVEHRERERIAAELHDSLCGDLATLKNYAIILELNQDPKLITSSISDIIQRVSQCHDEALRISYNLSPLLIKDNPINLLINTYLFRISKATPIVFSYKSTPQTFQLNETSRFELFRIVQELIQNIIKHSKSSYAEVYLHWETDYMTLTIKDNGIQYDFETELKKQNVGLGLASIKTRLHQIKADFKHISHEKNNLIELKLQKPNENQNRNSRRPRTF